MTKLKNNPSTDNDFTALLKQDDSEIPQVGDIVTGVVLSASKSEVRLDINGIIIGAVRGRELYYEAEEYANLKPGDKIEATVIEEENENGELELSFRHAGQERAWNNLVDAYKNGKIIKVKVDDANKGGLLVNFVQIAGFLPVSQLAPENYPRINGGDRSKILEKLRSFIGSEIEVKIMNLEKETEKLIVSERDAWQESQKDIVTKYKVGNLVLGKISAITNFGVFITFGRNLEGLIHISELAWQRVDNPASLFKVGDKIKAEIISIDGLKIFLSAKKLMSDPWQDVDKKYKIGQTVNGVILKVNPFGVFVELDKDIHGLAHISQLNLTSGQKINQVFKVGQEQKFTVVSIESEDHRLGLAASDNKQPTVNSKPSFLTAERETAKAAKKINNSKIEKAGKSKDVIKTPSAKIKKQESKIAQDAKDIKSARRKKKEKEKTK